MAVQRDWEERLGLSKFLLPRFLKIPTDTLELLPPQDAIVASEAFSLDSPTWNVKNLLLTIASRGGGVFRFNWYSTE